MDAHDSIHRLRVMVNSPELWRLSAFDVEAIQLSLAALEREQAAGLHAVHDPANRINWEVDEELEP